MGLTSPWPLAFRLTTTVGGSGVTAFTSRIAFTTAITFPTVVVFPTAVVFAAAVVGWGGFGVQHQY